MMYRRIFGLLATLVLLAGAASARAGGGPENVFVVINSSSWASQAVANHFIQLRQIPPVNVLAMPWHGGFESLDGETFRRRILVPTLDLIEKRRLTNQIDYVVYSSDFPYSIDLHNDFPGVTFSDQATPALSINSATYLWHLVMARQYILMDIHINHYMHSGRVPPTPSHGFRSWYGWGNAGDLQEAGGQPYLLSTMLAMTSGRGNSVREALSYLKRSAAADGTAPKGTIYFARTEDKRSQARTPGFEAAVAELKELGVKAEIINSAMPSGRPDVMGAMMGAADVPWSKSRNQILPGAIVENFTSYGGVMGESASQTPLSVFLRYGAAGSSGTIVEPFAIAEKFPSPFLFAHYARGCTLAESYYQSLFGPAQMLIVGDPLCRPWAQIPTVTLAGAEPGATVSGTVSLKPDGKVPGGGQVDHFELFVDGRRSGSIKPGESFAWDSTIEGDGHHELRAVAVAAGPIETQGRVIVPVIVDNHGHKTQFAALPQKTVRWDEKLRLRAKSPGMKQIFILQNGATLARIEGDEGETTIDPRRLGTGPITLQAVGTTGEGQRTWAYSRPLPIVVESAKPLPALKSGAEKLIHGLMLKLADNRQVPVQETRDPTWLAINGVRSEQPFSLQGYFDVPAEDIYQFQVRHYGELKLSVDNVLQYNGAKGNYDQQFAAVALAAGRHQLTVTGRAGDDLKLQILYGGPGTVSLSGTTFKHVRDEKR